MECQMGRNVWVITAFNIENEQLESIAVLDSLEKAKNMQLALYGDPKYNDGFTFFSIKEHVIQ